MTLMHDLASTAPTHLQPQPQTTTNPMDDYSDPHFQPADSIQDWYNLAEQGDDEDDDAE